jgi:hypothetical protein
MNDRPLFLLMAVAQVFFAIRLVRNPQAAKDVNIRMKTMWAKFPLTFYRGAGVVCAGAAILFFYMFLRPRSN